MSEDREYSLQPLTPELQMSLLRPAEEDGLYS